MSLRHKLKRERYSLALVIWALILGFALGAAVFGLDELYPPIPHVHVTGGHRR